MATFKQVEEIQAWQKALSPQVRDQGDEVQALTMDFELETGNWKLET